MNKINKVYYCLLTLMIFVLTSCSEFTDIKPKGKNLLSTTADLEMLLNKELVDMPTDEMTMAGDIINTSNNVSNQLSAPQRTRDIILITWDAKNQKTMAELTPTDLQYTMYYGLIGATCNPILQQIDNAEGSETDKMRIKSEALTLRAYCHYRLVNKFAKAYNPTTADNDRGIIYLTEKSDISVPQKQVSVQQVYDNILKDVNEAIKIDGLPVVAVNRMRMNKSCAYAVKALALLSMQKFDEAEEAAKQALKLNGTINNYTEMLNQSVKGMTKTYQCLLRPQLECEEDMFYTHYLLVLCAITPESGSRIEKGNVAFENIAKFDMRTDFKTNFAKTRLGVENHYYSLDQTSGWNSGGIKTTYMYLVMAEAELHKGNIDLAMETLDEIRKNRIDANLFRPLKGSVKNMNDAIKHIKETWSGEGIWSCYNFINRKRWNQVEGWKEMLSKNINGEQFTITPDSPMWIFPIPQNAVKNNSNIKQNFEE